MSAFLLSLHVLAAVLAVGPVTVAASLFPARARAALDGAPDQAPAVRLLHRITRVYALVGAAVPVLGIATAQSMGAIGDAWVTASLVLTAVAAAVLIARILPAQHDAVAALDRTPPHPATTTALRSLSAATGLFSLLWTAVLILMIIRPGSTTGV
ncbi:hypothetical protein LO771_14285 [Streptacidiphilus sp. ASG 303]|uniref:hypothetical protein n=1 Tax=Streptacidiphilus sp. ASG 303 TaxID=2896847 RepID=UPI001E47DA62|nr:hypothetical protein [Streptacidiphilus sp. ASG 303]MCD0483531.1 hypothetical protein [Streptacidiphilus sp. ASG 303]